MVAALFISAVLAAHIWVAFYLANDAPGDGKSYQQLAVNLLEQHVFSNEPQPPYTPTLIRLPGYPLFLSAVYALFGHGNNLAVRVVQAVIYTATCGIIALLAWNWGSDERRRKPAAWTAFILAALCPFTLIYTATILTETFTTFLMAAMTLSATYAFKSKSAGKLVLWWFLTGLLAGSAVLLRPDSGLFAFGIGLTLVISGVLRRDETGGKLFSRVLRTYWQGMVFSVAFMLPLVPWTIRNEEVFHLFQPLAPTHAEMPGEFVPQGYFKWVRTWIDDQKYIEPMLWNLEEKPIRVEKIPAYAFDSDDEKERVTALLDQYNHSSPNNQDDSPDSTVSGKSANDDAEDDAKDAADDDKDNDDNDKDAADDDKDDVTADDQDLQMTPEIDAGFAQIAQERIDHAPFRYYLWLPAKRAVGMWFDTHSMYYPFEGELFPLKNLDNEENQEIWLPLFSALVWIYTLLAAVGAFFMWRAVDVESRRWLLLATLMTLPRILFFATLENPEPRYVVELFAFTAILGGIALARLKFRRESGKISLELFYGKD